jgi:hypothetical protein
MLAKISSGKYVFDILAYNKIKTKEFGTPKPINYKEGDSKHKASNTIKLVMNNFRFQSFGGFRTLLEHFDLIMEEVQGSTMVFCIQ